ncbi:MAG: hypothetical protein IZT58_16735, partial [Actinobacteria bacterium]|nr:hypothetical protein [Actinomycetota bacterium]
MLVSVIAQQPTSQALLPDIDSPESLIATGATPDAPAEVSATNSQVNAALSQAVSDWQAVAPDADLSGITAAVSDLGGLELGRNSGSNITIDGNAAGWGWSASYPGESGRMDLVTVVRHEVGHVLGLGHSGGIMTSSLSPDASRGVTSSDAATLVVSEPVEVIVEEEATEPDASAESTEAGPAAESEPASTEMAESVETDPVAEPAESDPEAESAEPEPVVESSESDPAAEATEDDPEGESTEPEPVVEPTEPAVAVEADPLADETEPVPTPVLAVSVTEADAGVTSIGNVTTLEVIVSNIGDADLNLAELVISGSGSFSTDSAATVIAPDSSFTATISFAPTAVGSAAATLIITSDAGEATVALSGRGTAWSVEGGTATASLAGGAFDHVLSFSGGTAALTGASGLVDSIDLAGVTQVVIAGGGGNDSLTLGNGSAPVATAFNGGGGNDSLLGPASNTTWSISGSGSGAAAGASFSGIEYLIGASGNEDTFVWSTSASLAGYVDGGAGGFDTLDIDGGDYAS